MAPTSEAKSAARNERDQYKRHQADATFVGALIGVASIASPAMLAPSGVVIGFSVWWCHRTLITVERKIEDPARLDIDATADVLGPPVFSDGFGDDSLGVAAYDVFSRLSRVIGLEDAAVTTMERLAGIAVLEERTARHAELDRLRSIRRDREKELAAHLQAARAAAKEATGPAQRLSGRLQDADAQLVPLLDRVPEPVHASLFRARLLDLLREPVQASLFRAGASSAPMRRSVQEWVREGPSLIDMDTVRRSPMTTVGRDMKEALDASRRALWTLEREVSRTFLPEPGSDFSGGFT